MNRHVTNRTRAALFGATLVCIAFGCATAPGPATPSPPSAAGNPVAPAAVEPSASAAARAIVGQALPEVTVRELADGARLSTRSLAGQVVLIDIWASWCAPCREELPMLDEMAPRLKEKGVQIVAVSIDEDEQAARAFLRLQDRWSLRLALDPDQAVPAALAPPRMPSSYVVDRQGRLRAIHAGFERADAARIEAELLALARSTP